MDARCANTAKTSPYLSYHMPMLQLDFSLIFPSYLPVKAVFERPAVNRKSSQVVDEGETYIQTLFISIQRC